MKAEQFAKNVLTLETGIRFAGVMEKSGHLHAGVRRNETEELLKGRNTEISFAQSAYIVDLRKMFTQELGNLKSVIYSYEKVKLISVPVKDHVLVISTEPNLETDAVVEKVLSYIKSVESELSLYPPANIVDEEKKEALQNLYHSGISEELIAEQLDLDVNTVKLLIAEIK